MEKHGTARQAANCNIKRRMRVACCITKATDTSRILTGFPLKQRFRVHTVLRHTHILPLAHLLLSNKCGWLACPRGADGRCLLGSCIGPTSVSHAAKKRKIYSPTGNGGQILRATSLKPHLHSHFLEPKYEGNIQEVIYSRRNRL